MILAAAHRDMAADEEDASQPVRRHWLLGAAMFAVAALVVGQIYLNQLTDQKNDEIRFVSQGGGNFFAVRAAMELRSLKASIAAYPYAPPEEAFDTILLDVDILYTRSEAAKGSSALAFSNGYWSRLDRDQSLLPDLEGLIAELDETLTRIGELDYRQNMIEKVDALATRFTQASSQIGYLNQNRLLALNAELQGLNQFRTSLSGALVVLVVILAGLIVLELRRLQESRTRYALALDGANDGVIDWNIKRNTLSLGTRNRDMLGATTETLPDNVRAFLRRMDKSDRHKLMIAIRSHIYEGQNFNIQVRMRHDDGRNRWFRARARMLRDSEGRPARLIGTNTDITDLVETSRKLSRKTTEAENLSRSLEAERRINAMQRQFVSMVSHEFRTPLTVIDGRADQLMRKIGKMPPERVLDRLAVIRASVTQLTELIESVLTGARLEDGKLSLQAKSINLSELLTETVNRAREIFRHRTINLTTHVAGERFVCDPTLIRQVFSNLLSNASKYSDDGAQIDVRMELEPNGKALKISVEDNGVGIPKDESEKIFDRFVRARTSAGRPGTGIGLHMIQQFVALHGGWVDIESVEGEGSTFDVYLPTNIPVSQDIAA